MSAGQADEVDPTSWRYRPTVPFARLVDALYQTAGWLSGYPDPDTYYREGEPESEQMLAAYDGLLLRLAEMLEVPVPALAAPMDWQRRQEVVDGLAAAGVPADWMQLYH